MRRLTWLGLIGLSSALALHCARPREPDVLVLTTPPPPPPDVDVDASVAPTEDPFTFTGDPPAPDAGCPEAIHPFYCRFRCRSFDDRKMNKHAYRVDSPKRFAIGTCGSLQVFAEEQADGGGIIEYYDDAGTLTSARDNRLQGCKDFGDVPKCTPKLDWKPSSSAP